MYINLSKKGSLENSRPPPLPIEEESYVQYVKDKVEIFAHNGEREEISLKKERNLTEFTEYLQYPQSEFLSLWLKIHQLCSNM